MRASKLLVVVLLAALFGGPSEPYRSEYYDAPQPRIELSSDEQRVLDELNAALVAQNVPALRVDSRICLVSRHISSFLEDQGIEQVDRFDTERIKGLLADAGVSDGRILINVGNWRGLDSFIDSAVPQLVNQARNAGLTHVGVGVETSLLSRISYVALIVTKRPAELGTFPRKVATGQAHTLLVAPNPGVKGVEVHLSDPRGRPLAIESRRAADGRLFTELRFDAGAGEYTIEVTFQGRFGPEVAALYTVACGGGSGAQPRAPLSAFTDVNWDVRTEAEAEDLLLMLINDERAANKLPALTPYAPLTAVARAHCRDMVAHNFVGHDSPTSGDISDRVDAAGIKWLRVTENIARAENVQEAHRGLMGSPVHRRNVLDPEVQFVGIGVAFMDTPQQEPQVLLTIDFLSLR